jgi:hypothetical protein
VTFWLVGAITRDFPIPTHSSLWWTGGGIGTHWGPLSPPSVGATTRDEQWTVCRDMMRGSSNGLRAHFTRATAHHQIDLPAAAGAREQPLAPIEHAMAFPARPNFAATQSQRNPEARGSPSRTRTSEPTAGAASHTNLGPTGGREGSGDLRA